MKRKFTIEFEHGEVILEAKQALLDELLGKEWQSSFYTFADENDLVPALARWIIDEPPNYRGEHGVDGLCGFTTDDLKIIKDNTDDSYLWENPKVS